MSVFYNVFNVQKRKAQMEIQFSFVVVVVILIVSVLKSSERKGD